MSDKIFRRGFYFTELARAAACCSCFAWLTSDTVNHCILLSSLSGLCMAPSSLPPGSTKDRCWGHCPLSYTHPDWGQSCTHMVFQNIAIQRIPSRIRPFPKVLDKISDCLSDISSWMQEHNLLVSCHDCCKTDFFWSCSLNLRLVPLCIIQQNWLFLTQLATQLLLQTTVISCIHYCNALPTGDPMCVMKPLQMVHSVVVHLISRPTSPHCWSSSTGYRKSLMLAFRVLAGSTPSWLNNLLRALLPLICWVPQMSTVWNPNYFPTLFPNRGTTSRALSELRQPCLPSSFLFRDISSKSTISPHLLSPLLLYPPSLPLYSSTLLVASGTCTM